MPYNFPNRALKKYLKFLKCECESNELDGLYKMHMLVKSLSMQRNTQINQLVGHQLVGILLLIFLIMAIMVTLKYTS